MLEWFWNIRGMCFCYVLGISLLCEPLTCYLRKFETIYINVYRIFMLDVVYIYYRNVLAMSWSSNLDTLFQYSYALLLLNLKETSYECFWGNILTRNVFQCSMDIVYWLGFNMNFNVIFLHH